MNNRRKAIGRVLSISAGAVFFASPVFAAEDLSIALNEYFHFEADSPVVRTAVANPDIADIIVIPGNDMEFLVVAKKPGQTTLIVWYSDGSMQDYRISIGPDDNGQAGIIEKAIDLPGVRVRVVVEGERRRILLEGTVRDQIEHARAIGIARLYTVAEKGELKKKEDDDDKFEYNFEYDTTKRYDSIIDLLTIAAPTQIHLEAQIVEVSSDDAKNVGFRFNQATDMTSTAIDGGREYFNSVTLGETGVFAGGESFRGHDTGFWLIDHFSKINATVNFLISKGKAKILSRPNISTMSGSKAKIHIGGDMPYPTVSTNGATAIEWKQYGIKLNILPTLEGDGKITAEVHAEVSAPDYTHTVATTAGTLPSIRTRNAHSMVHIRPGYTMVIGGLLSSEEQKSISGIPLLSNIPILGEFFKYRNTTHEKRELIVLLTPRIVNDDGAASMSDKMKEWYEKETEWAKKRNQVELNEEIKAEEKAAREAAEREAAAKEKREAVRRVRPVGARRAEEEKREPDSLAIAPGEMEKESGKNEYDGVEFGRSGGR